MSSTSKRREGFAMVIAMVAIVVIGALIAGAFFTSTQEYRIGRNSLVAQRAYSAAEAGVTQPIQGWIKALNLSVNKGVTRAPDTLKLPGGDIAVRRLTRLDDYTFWVTSDGYAGGTGGQLASHARVNTIYRLAIPSFNIQGALTVKSKVEIKGSSLVDGTDLVPPDWVAGGVCPAPGPAVAGVAGADTSIVCSGNCPDNGKARMFGDPPKLESTTAGDPNTYIKFGDITWTNLAANADIKLPGGTYDPEPTPSGACDLKNTSNWGDPARTTQCADYFPIIYVKGDLKVAANAMGQGILLVEGSLEMSGGFVFNGIVIAQGDVKSTGHGNKVVGSVFAGNTYDTDSNNVNGNAEVHYSSCAIDRAQKGSATVVRAKQRGFAQIVQ